MNRVEMGSILLGAGLRPVAKTAWSWSQRVVGESSPVAERFSGPGGLDNILDFEEFC